MMQANRGAEPEVIIREAEADDARSLLEYIEDTAAETDFLAFGPGEFSLTDEEEAEFLESCRKSPNEVYLMALIGDTIVGTLSFTGGHRPRNRHAGEFGMTVRKMFWGQGIGSLLLDSLIAWARGGGVVTKINLEVRADNERAINLYERKGFEREGRILNSLRHRGKFYDCLTMGLILDREESSPTERSSFLVVLNPNEEN
jgi:RimJ/RimL family protein N-acetyltransferase